MVALEGAVFPFPAPMPLTAAALPLGAAFWRPLAATPAATWFPGAGWFPFVGVAFLVIAGMIFGKVPP